MFNVMPELPEVQTIVNDLKAYNVVGEQIAAVRVFWPRSVESLPQHYINKTLVGLKIKLVSRRGKYIVFELDNNMQILIHLRMSGRIAFCDKNAYRDKHEHVCLTLDNGKEIRLHDTRKFARVYIGENCGDRIGKLGYEPLTRSFNARVFSSIVHDRARAIKPLLLDQSLIAGLGNIYADEALWRAKVHPKTISSELSPNKIKTLCEAIKSVLRKGIKNCGTSLGHGDNNFFSLGKQRGRNRDKLTVYHRTGEACLRCGTKIVRITVAQRGTHLCPRCQK
jgi:formamidopyrimidine-DNA glycosylase